MAVPAGSCRTSPIAVNLRHQGVDASAVRAGTYALGVDHEVVSGWHSHNVHQLEYALEGVAEVETATARYLLPPQQAVWIPAGMVHSSTLTNVKAFGVFFDPAMGLPAGDRVRILAAAPVIREMILYAKQWSISRTSKDVMADSFFEALGYLVVEWLDRETPLCLPTSSDPLVAAAMDYTNEHLAEVSLPKVCAAVGTSERSLRRAFVAATGMSWRRYYAESRLVKAKVLLAQDAQNITAVALAVGFESVSAFTRAFGQYAGETPTAYRQRAHAG
ncbi:MAG: helix-turn-helix domain-containing protein [Frankia sp.]